jgi:uncharacterized protein (DUF2336 family)
VTDQKRARPNLSKDDVKRLLEDPSADNRATTAGKIATTFSAGSLTGHEREIAEDIFKLMVRDVEVRVREALSVNLKDCSFAPREVAVSLARDVDAVALPMLQFSSVLKDSDLIEIVQSQGPSKQKAVAKRAKVSAKVSEAIVQVADAEVVSTLVANEGASIAEPTFQKALDRFGKIEAVNRSMALRKKLPVAVSERLVTLVSEKIREHILTHHDLPPGQVSDLILQSRERATLALLTPESSSNDVRELVSQLYLNDRLTPTIILRAVCLGDMRFFEAAVAVLSEIPLVRARRMVHDEGPEGLASILETAKIPRALRPAFRAAVEVCRETDYDGGENDRERYQRRMIERILTQVEDPADKLGDENTDYLLKKLAQIDVHVAAHG